ncbi:restriction endonuclease subunit S [Dyadobacter sp. NIV53]|uniref:restriction endonuclease subunit S n=1 Tax=Dyadobacter sp. NIV53 TaxID=2861765 RepID=UPI001C86CFD1|nr:restriction endonuclease subunit S [Dyadobacter sp. NIV53]
MNNDTNKLIPELRFPEFVNEGKWDEKTVGDIYDFKVTNSFSRENLNYDKGLVKNIHYGDIHTRFNTLFDILKEKVPYINLNVPIEKIREESFCVEGDMVFADASEDLNDIGKSIEIINLNGQAVLPGLHTLLARQKERRLITGFGGHLFKTYSIRKQIQREAQGAKVLGISVGRISNVNISFPKNPKEQQKITSCLSSLDEVIAAHSQKLEVLKEHKKGLMQNLFPQEGETVPKYRFPEFLGDADWVEKSIQKLIDENKIISHLDGNHGALYPKAEEFSKEGIPYISANDFISGIIDFSKCKYLPLSKANKFKKGVAKDGDILFAHNATVGPVAKLNTDFPFVILSTTATYFRCDNKNLINDFLRFALTSPSFVRQYTRVMSQSTRNQIPITAQREFILQIPKPKEQQKIAECLSSLDNSITVQVEKVEQLKLYKRGLMQGLFPKVIEE